MATYVLATLAARNIKPRLIRAAVGFLPARNNTTSAIVFETRYCGQYNCSCSMVMFGCTCKRYSAICSANLSREKTEAIGQRSVSGRRMSVSARWSTSEVQNTGTRTGTRFLARKMRFKSFLSLNYGEILRCSTWYCFTLERRCR